MGKQKLRHKRVFYLFLHLPVFQGLARVDFGSVLIPKISKNKKQLSTEKTAFWAEKHQKIVFVGVCKFALKNFFAICLYSSDYTQTHKLAVHLESQGVATKKTDNFMGKKLRFGPKNFKKEVFRGFQTLHH